MGILSWLFGGKRKASGDTGHGNLLSPSYDKHLVDKLKADHEELVAIFTQIKEAATSRQYHKIGGLLTNFKMALQAHVMTENVKFYVYVQEQAKNNPEKTEFISNVRKDMNGIANAVVKFTQKHTSNTPTSHSIDNFLFELDGIGNALLKRVELEETELYSLYQA